MAPWFRKGKEPKTQSLVHHRTDAQKAEAAKLLVETGGAHLVGGRKPQPTGAATPAPAGKVPRTETSVMRDTATAAERAQRAAAARRPKMPDPVMDRETRKEFNEHHNVIARLMQRPEELFWLGRADKPYRKGHAPSVHAHNMITAAHAGDLGLVVQHASAAARAYKNEAAVEQAAAEQKKAAGQALVVIKSHLEAVDRNTQHANAYALLAKDPGQAIQAMEALRKAAGKN